MLKSIAPSVTALLLLSLSTNLLLAQNTNKVYEYSMVRNNAKDGLYRNLSLGIDPFWLDVQGEKVAMGSGIYARYVLKNKVRFNLGFDIAYLDRISGPSCRSGKRCIGHMGISLEESKNYRGFNFGANYFFTQSVKEVMEKVTLKVTGNTAYVAQIPAKMSQVYGIRFEYHSDYGYVYSGNGDIDFVMYATDDESKNTITRSGVDYSTMMTTTVWSFGLNRIRQHDMVVNFKGLGERGARYSSEIYADMMLGTTMGFSNMIITDSIASSGVVVSWKEYNVDEFTAKSKIGWRLGWATYPGKKISYIKIEGGVRPGPAMPIEARVYLHLRWGIYVSFKA